MDLSTNIRSLKTRRAVLLGILLGALLGASPGLGRDARAEAPDLRAPSDALADAPFEEIRHEGLHRINQVWPLEVSDCAGNERDLLVLSAEGSPPRQIKHLTWMPCGSALRPQAPEIVRRQLGNDVVLVDVAKIPGREGPQLLTASARGLRVESLDARPGAAEAALRLPIPGGLPLPPRPRELSRIEMVGDWNSDGRPVALVPSTTGGLLIELKAGAVPRSIPMPVFANYRTWEPFFPRVIWKRMIAETRWPALAREDDNGDGRPDLFVLSRWAIWIYHTGPKGLPDQPSRRLDFTPFDEETERRHEATGFSYFAGDLDGTPAADLILNTSGGGLTKGRSTTRLFVNAGAGVRIDGPARAERETDGGFAGIELIDLDRDGRNELLETTIEFGVLKVVGLLLTGKTEIKLRVLEPDASMADGFRVRFEDDLSLRLDLTENRLEGLVPALGDWNGDGQEDLVVARGSRSIGFRLGSADPDQPLFGRALQPQPLPIESGETRVADLDGDELDEIIAFEFRAAETPLVVLRNRGRLPGTPPQMRSADRSRSDN